MLSKTRKIIYLSSVVAGLLTSSIGLHSVANANPNMASKSATSMASASSMTAQERSVYLEEVKNIAYDAYIYLYPLVIMDVSMKNFTKDVPVNVFQRYTTFPTPEDKSVVRLNFDTLYTMGYLDVSKEPVIVTVPDNNQYYLLQVMDLWSNVFFGIGTRVTGSVAGSYAFVGPKWKGTLPKNVTPVMAPTNIIWIIGRNFTLPTPAGIAATNSITEKYQVAPLSVWNDKAKLANYKTSVLYTTPTGTSPVKVVADMSAQDFFRYAITLLRDNPPNDQDQPIIARIRRAHLTRDQVPNLMSLDKDVQDAIVAGYKMAQEGVKVSNLFTTVKSNNWQFVTLTGNYGIAYETRAWVAFMGLGANLMQDALYPTAFVDANGDILNAENDYEIVFKKGQLPPSDAFWSITVYDENSFQIPNEINRFNLNSKDPNFKINEDGDTVIYLSSQNPGSDKESNWIPTKGIFNLTMRIYSPRLNEIGTTWHPPYVRKVEASTTSSSDTSSNTSSSNVMDAGNQPN